MRRSRGRRSGEREISRFESALRIRPSDRRSLQSPIESLFGRSLLLAASHGAGMDPHPTIWDLFTYYNDVYFSGCLGRVLVEWSSSRMTSCGGVCSHQPGGAITIRLSSPLLSLRPFEDTQDVLLHEMIHAEHFAKGIIDDDPGGHGKLFKRKMDSINTWTGVDIYRPRRGYTISITHSMIAEVRYFQRHHWVCLRCGDMIRRSMNRPPQKADCRAYRKGRDDVDCRDLSCRWHVHKRYCRGVYVKVAGDEAKGERENGGGHDGPGYDASYPGPSTYVDLTVEDIFIDGGRNDGGRNDGGRNEKEESSRPPPEIIDLTCERTDGT